MNYYIMRLMYLLFFLSCFVSSLLTANVNNEKVFTIYWGDLDFDAVNFHPLYTYDTQAVNLQLALFEGLVSYDPTTLQPKPALASRWEVSADKKEYRFIIRDASFSNGEPILAQDVYDTWTTILQNNDGNASWLDVVEGAREYRLGSSTTISGLQVEGEHIFIVRLIKRTNHFLKLLAHTTFSVVHKSLLPLKNIAIQTIMQNGLISNGPYIITNYNEKGIYLERNREYWDIGNTAIQHIQWVRNQDAEGNIIKQKFIAGEIQWIGQYMGNVGYMPHIEYAWQYSSTFFYFNNNSKWKKKHLRRALLLALPYDVIRNNHWNAPTANLVPPTNKYPSPVGITQKDIEKALEELHLAGYKVKQKLPNLVVVVSEFSGVAEILSIMKKTWEDIFSISVSIETVSYNKMRKRIKSGDFDMALMSWVADYADPMSFLEMWYSTSSINDAQYNNKQYDSLLEQSYGINNLYERYKYLAQAEALLLDDALVIPLTHGLNVNYIDLNKIGGWYNNLLNIHPYKYLYYKSLRPPLNIVMNSK